MNRFSSFLPATVLRATRLGFFIAGFALSVWAPLVPYVRERIPMDDGVFGLLLLCIGIGSLTCMPLSAHLSSRWGVRRVIVISTLMLILALLGMAMANHLVVLAVALFMFGGSLGVLDIVLNIQGLRVEQRAGRTLMSNFHGMFSFGTICGSVLMAILLTLGVSAIISPLIMIALIVIALFVAYSGLLKIRPKHASGSFVRPTPFVLLVGLLCFVVYLAEGAVLDWSALFLIQNKDMPTAQAGLGYACFALMVTVGRFSGDWLRQLLGHKVLLMGGSLLAAGGIVLSIVATHWLPALIGYALCGLGGANVSPLLMSLLNRQTHMPPHLAVTAATTIGFAGVLAGPALMGGVAHISSLTYAFAALAVLLALIAFAAPRLRV